MNRTSVSSSNIASVGYENGTLEIAFLSGHVYQYFDVPEQIYQRLMSAASKGQYFNGYIKPDFKQARCDETGTFAGFSATRFQTSKIGW